MSVHVDQVGARHTVPLGRVSAVPQSTWENAPAPVPIRARHRIIGYFVPAALYDKLASQALAEAVANRVAAKLRARE